MRAHYTKNGSLINEFWLSFKIPIIQARYLNEKKKKKWLRKTSNVNTIFKMFLLNDSLIHINKQTETKIKKKKQAYDSTKNK